MNSQDRLSAETLTAAYNSGLSIAQIASRSHLSAEAVRRLMKQYGIQPRRRGRKLRQGGDCSVQDSDGYVLERSVGHPDAVNGYVRAHRLVMERVLGRRLKKGESVLHLNGVRDDNRPENLRVFDSSSNLASYSLQGNSRARGDFGNPKRRFRVRRTPRQMLRSVTILEGSLNRPIRRSDLKPPYPSYRALKRAFGSWQLAVVFARGDAIRRAANFGSLFDPPASPSPSLDEDPQVPP